MTAETLIVAAFICSFPAQAHVVGGGGYGTAAGITLRFPWRDLPAS